jgi:arylsulfatase A-like enzyme
VLAYYFSLNPHTPFELPDPKYRRFGPEVPHAEMLNAMAYTDAQLGRFFENARQSGYWQDTVFMVTADHNMGKWEMNYRERQWIPLLVLVPGDPTFPRGRIDATLGSQLDIAPTALDLLGLSAAQAFGGQSLLRPAAHRFALFNFYSQVGWLDEDVLLLHDMERPLALFDRHADPGLTTNRLRPGTVLELPEVADVRAYVQTFNNLLVANRMAPGGAAAAAVPLPAPTAAATAR